MAALCQAPAAAQTMQRYDLPAQDLGLALQTFGKVAGREVVVAGSLVAGKRSNAAVGIYTAEQALAILLARTGLHAELVDGAFVIRAEADDIVADASNGGGASAITVTGSRIRGAEIASPVITVSREDARKAGQATLGDIVRSIPQSFGGGQNPEVGLNVPYASGSNVGGGSSLNLRGLGSDATLTLLNGHRLSYSGSRQSIDVSTIPLGVVDRIEIVPDGASAIYGSDAIGGVANIILRRDMSGLEMRARIGGSTEGGNFSQQYGVTGGARWTDGGFIAAYEFNRTTAIDYDDRDYAVSRSPGLRLLPSARSHNALLSAHQTLASSLEFSIDGLYNRRRTLTVYSYDPSGDLAVDRIDTLFKDRAFAIAPALSLELANNFNVTLSGSYAEDRVDYRADDIRPTGRTTLTAGCYCNRARSVELAADGGILRLPGGLAKAAIGAGYRSTYLKNDRGAGYALNFAHTQDSVYAYGELSLPIVGPDNARPGIARLDLSAAARYEDYDAIGDIATPKFGLIYSPVDAVDLKASWGKSFRAPTLYQQYQPPSVTVVRAAPNYGDFPVGATLLFRGGGRADLRPERATTWSVSAAFHPRSIEGLSVEAAYFSTRYVDRTATPITYSREALSNPIYADLITRAPTLAQVTDVVDAAALFSNPNGLAFDPATVVAIIDNRNLNVGRQSVHGVDGLIGYRTDLGASGDSLSFSGNATYFVSRRQLAIDTPTDRLAGTIFNPSHWRGRATASWNHDGLTVTGVANYTGALVDPRTSSAVSISPQATFDLALHYVLPAPAGSALHGIDITLAAQNILDRPPPVIATTLPNETPYDSTNYSAIGRFISLTVAKAW
ncbi:TonB-dependent receptor domain-containing protein [Hephaestia sp. GCM10023244]|uniref:TonB-dependent receptor n=2 Tax=unclassified Hephaestia TaxID=2631281 RepID=UPI0020774184|nr:TonB-dependent receptor [Hephaestia sp. MAHUQ-44]MCM8732416.1 TonB-dependent receptor [Hephaestia sp. MAHUQ-44]